MGDLFVQYWPLFVVVCSVVAWGARLEQKASNTVTREEHAATAQSLVDVKDSVKRIETKVDRLLER